MLDVEAPALKSLNHWLFGQEAFLQAVQVVKKASLQAFVRQYFWVQRRKHKLWVSNQACFFNVQLPEGLLDILRSEVQVWHNLA